MYVRGKEVLLFAWRVSRGDGWRGMKTIFSRGSTRVATKFRSDILSTQLIEGGLCFWNNGLCIWNNGRELYRAVSDTRDRATPQRHAQLQQLLLP